MNGDLISRSALLEHMKGVPTWWADDGGVYPGGPYKYPDGMFDPEDVVSSIENAPAADAVEVVRCKECKHFCPYEGEEHKGDCDELVGLESCVYEDDFCSYGNRRYDE